MWPVLAGPVLAGDLQRVALVRRGRALSPVRRVPARMAGGGERWAPATGVFIALVTAAVGIWSPPAPAQESIPQAVHRIDGTVRELGRQSREMDRKSREMDRKLEELDRKLREVDRTARELNRRLGELERAGSGGSGQESSGEAVEAGLGLTREDRRRIQRALTAQGYRPGSPDGQFGRRTRTAIAEWQAARGAKPTGYLGADGVKILLAAAPEVVGGGAHSRLYAVSGVGGGAGGELHDGESIGGDRAVP